MKTLLRIFPILLMALGWSCTPAQAQRLGVTVDTNGVIRYPENFWQTNRPGFATNFPLYIDDAPLVGPWRILSTPSVAVATNEQGEIQFAVTEDAGTLWYSDAGAPAGGLGEIGDRYLNTTNGDHYEKTGASTWTLRGNLTGPTGATGATGAQGPQGDPGATGAQGPQGDPGAQGAAGADGADGADGSVWHSGSGAPDGGLGVVGDRYLNTANGDHYEKTGASTWTLRGNLTGPTGATGAQGPQGDAGATGAAGADGADGAAGADGADGSVWHSGSGAPDGGLGVVGDRYLDTANGDHYEKTGASTWTLRGNLTGPTGATGATGPAGADGADGADGAGSKTIANLNPFDYAPPSANWATIGERNAIPILQFDGTTSQTAYFVFVVPDGADLSLGISVNIPWMAATATSGTTRWCVAFEDMTATDLDANSFDTETCANGTANGTSGITTTTTVTSTDIDSVVAGRPLRIAVRRDTSVGGNMSGIAQLVAGEVRTAN